MWRIVGKAERQLIAVLIAVRSLPAIKTVRNRHAGSRRALAALPDRNHVPLPVFLYLAYDTCLDLIDDSRRAVAVFASVFVGGGFYAMAFEYPLSNNINFRV